MAKSWQDVAKITSANLEGHKYLYDHGFYVITSTKSSIEYFKENSLKTSGMVWQEFLSELDESNIKIAENLEDNPKKSKGFYEKIKKFKMITQEKLSFAKDSVVEAEVDLAKSSGGKALSGFLTGYVTIKKRTEKDFLEIKNISNSYFSALKSDFSNLKTLVEKFKKRKKEDIESSDGEIKWRENFSRAKTEFNKEYEKTKSDQNTLVALPRIVWGHLKAMYWAVVKPVGESVYFGVSESGNLLTKGIEKFILLPVASSVIVGGRTLYTIGGVVYHAGGVGINILSPITETTLHAAVSLAAITSTIPSYTFIGGVNIFSQITLTGSSIVLPAAGYAANTAVDLSVYTGKVIYETAKSTGEIIYGNSKSAVVLGYNAVSALPTHILMGAVNSTIFLVYDGPRIFVAWTKGEFANGELPIGSILDYQKLKEANVEINQVELDEAQLKRVINGIEVDLGE